MNLTNVASVFSRYVVIGFFLPSFFALLVLWKTLSADFPPNRLHYSEAANVAVLGGIALLVALLLVGAHDEVFNLFLFNPLESTGPKWLVNLLVPLAVWLRSRSIKRWHALQKDLESSDPKLRFEAMSELERFFPWRERPILTTRLGNVIDAWRGHSFTRWFLDYDAAWPRIEAMLTDQERALHDDARTTLAFFLNAGVLALVAWAVYFGDWVAYRSVRASEVWWVAPLVLSYVFYRLTVRSAARMGDRIRASIDIHRLDLYSKLSVREPGTVELERQVAESVNQALLWRVPIPDEYRSPRPVPPGISSV